jgi:hypothetical protein
MLQNYKSRLNYVVIRKLFFSHTALLIPVITISLVLLLDTQGILAYGTLSPSSPLLAEDLSAVTTGNLSNSSLPSAESVHSTETLELPQGIDAFIILIPNEAHESWQDERHKLITDRNAY